MSWGKEWSEIRLSAIHCCTCAEAVCSKSSLTIVDHFISMDQLCCHSSLLGCCAWDDQTELRQEDDSEGGACIYILQLRVQAGVGLTRNWNQLVKTESFESFPSLSSNNSFLTKKGTPEAMSGVGERKEGSKYKMVAASSTPFSSQDFLWDGKNQTKEAENPQKLTTSGEEQSSQASVYQHQQEQ